MKELQFIQDLEVESVYVIDEIKYTYRGFDGRETFWFLAAGSKTPTAFLQEELDLLINNGQVLKSELKKELAVNGTFQLKVMEGRWYYRSITIHIEGKRLYFTEIIIKEEAEELSAKFGVEIVPC